MSEEVSTARIYMYPGVPMPMGRLGDKGLEIPRSSGVYFIWNSRKDQATCVYVGQALNLRTRVVSSHDCIEPLDDVSYLHFRPADLNFAEAYYIGILQPGRNFGEHNRQKQRLAKIQEFDRRLVQYDGDIIKAALSGTGDA